MDVKKQIDSFEKIIKKFSKREVKTFLDIACGTSLQLREIAKRGYNSIGLDSSKEMLTYLQNKAKEDNLKIETIKANMYNFKLKKKVDFAFILLGSLTPKSNKEFLSHLDSVASSLNKGGLYLIQNNNFDFRKIINNPQQWTESRDGISVKTTYEAEIKDILHQIIREHISLEVKEYGKEKTFGHYKYFKFIAPQELKLLVEKNNKFKFLGWYPGDVNTWYLNKSLEKAKDVNMNIILLRRK